MHSSTIGPRFIRHNSQLYRHADYPRPYGNGAFTHCSPIVNADGRFCIPITCHGNGSCHYEEFPYDDCDSAIVHPYKFRHLIQQANGHLTFAQQNESLEDQMAVGNIVDHSVVDRRRLSMSIDRHVRRPPPDTKPPPPPAPADMCIQNQLIKTSGSAELPFTEFVRTSTIYSNNSSNMSIEKIV